MVQHCAKIRQIGIESKIQVHTIEKCVDLAKKVKCSGIEMPEFLICFMFKYKTDQIVIDSKNLMFSGIGVCGMSGSVP